MSYVWADHADRLARLKAAFATALADPPRVARMEAAQWVEKRILQVDPERPGVRYIRRDLQNTKTVAGELRLCCAKMMIAIVLTKVAHRMASIHRAS